MTRAERKNGEKAQEGVKDESKAERMGEGPATLEKNRAYIMTGLTLGLLLASLDQTVVGTSMPRIVGDLGGLDKFSWLFSGYMLAATVMIPLAGKMSDRYGRRPVFLFGMIAFLSGSMLAGLAQNMDQLIAFRFLQGFGGGSMLPVAVATVADLYAPTERGKVQGALGAVFSLCSIIGPFIGGWIVDHVSWRWVFYVNLPVGLAAIAVTMVKFPSVSSRLTKPIDYTGIMLLSIAVSSFLFITFWGGDKYDWASKEIIGLAVVCTMAFISFIFVELRVKDPVLPLPLFKEPVFSLGCLGLMMMAMGMFGIIAFLPLFLQAVVGFTATYSGEVLIPLMITAMLGAIISGSALKYTGYKVWFVIGPLIGAFGLYLLSTLNPHSEWTSAVAYLAIVGLGLGFVMSNYIVAAQNVVNKKDIGVVSSTMSLFRAFGGTIGVTVFGVIVNRRMEHELEHNLPPGASDVLPSSDINTLGGLLLSDASKDIPAPILDGIKDSLSNSITYAFLIGAFIIIVAWFISIFIRSVPLKSKEEYLNGGSSKKGDKKVPTKDDKDPTRMVSTPKAEEGKELGNGKGREIETKGQTGSLRSGDGQEDGPDLGNGK